MSLGTMPRRDSVDAKVARRWLAASLHGLADARETIDRLNVFPIPDGDTGTNMYLTVEAAVAAVQATQRDIPYPDALRAGARGAFLGARGNSGVILSQMLRGLAEVLAEAPEPGAGPDGLAQALQRACALGYESVAEPVEGTMLTVMRVAADAATQAVDSGVATLIQVATVAADAADGAVIRTREQLDVLTRAGVVDAGGAGVAVVLRAIETALAGRRSGKLATRPPAHSGVTAQAGWMREPATAASGTSASGTAASGTAASGAGARPAGWPGEPAGVGQSEAHARPSEPGYEVMYLLDATEAAIPALRAALDALGDSLLVVGGEGLWNVHVHVDDVGAAIEAGIEAGRPHRIRVTRFDDQHGRLHQPDAAAVVAVAAGGGLAELFTQAGAEVVRMTQGQRPSTGEVLAAVLATGAEHVVVLPNDRDVVAVAKAAAAEAEKAGVRVAIIPTVVQVQGVAALAVHVPGRPFDADVVEMTAAAGHVRHGGVTVAARRAVTSVGICHAGDVLGILHGDFAIIGQDLREVSAQVLERMLAAGGELVTLVLGSEDDTRWTAPLVAQLRSEHPEVDIVTVVGGQPRYPLLLGVE